MNGAILSSNATVTKKMCGSRGRTGPIPDGNGGIGGVFCACGEDTKTISGKMRLEVQRVDFPSVVAAALEGVRPAAEAREVRVQSILDPMTEPLHGDPARLQQVLWNLLSNAVKFTPKGGHVQVVLARVNSHVELYVSDTGSGIKAEFLEHVFERFRQADSSTARSHGGLGLGLAIVKQLVELHGGSVAVASPGEGKGATFTVKLPLAVAHHSVDEAPKSHPPVESHFYGEELGVDLSGVLILVVDDEPDGSDLVKRLLEDTGAEVLIAAAADEAINVIT